MIGYDTKRGEPRGKTTVASAGDCVDCSRCVSACDHGADLAIYSAHKFLGGPTAGIIAGRKDLVRACFLQNMGIGRGMKVGKEGVAGAIAALDAWERRDHAGIRAAEKSHLDLWVERFSKLPGIKATIVTKNIGVK